MIVSELRNLKSQVVMTPNLESAIDFLLERGNDELPAGRLVVDGERVYVEVQSYDTIEGGDWRFEGHRKYLDIQYVVEGQEIIGWASIADATVTTPYRDDHDAWLGTVDPEFVTSVRLRAGQLALLYPEDAHAPRRAAGAVSPVRKLVVKVAI